MSEQWETFSFLLSGQGAQRQAGGAELARGPAGVAGEAPGPGLTTGRVQGAALGGRHPEVGGARVKDDSEGLRRGADADLTVILGLQGEGERWPEGLGGPWGLPDTLFGTRGEMRQTM